MNFVNPANLIASLELEKGHTVADFGCGGGYFCLPAAKLTGDDGTVYAVDILPPRLEAVASSAKQNRLVNLRIVRADLEKPISQIPQTSCDWVFMGNIIHQVKQSKVLLANAYRVLKTGGKLLVVDWKKEVSLFGPPRVSRVGLDEVSTLCDAVGLRKSRELPADKFHYAALFVK